MSPRDEAGRSPAPQLNGGAPPMMRVGVGYDSHRFARGRPLVLGGIDIPFDQGLVGHSDADVVAHAVTDAILGAAAHGDIGIHFPQTDPRWKDADSIELLRAAASMIADHGYQTLNIDISVVCEAPTIAPYAPAMRARLAEALGVGMDQVSVKGKSNERMGWIGRREGIAVVAVALLSRTSTA